MIRHAILASKTNKQSKLLLSLQASQR